jgi:hypothetical protein
MVIEHSIVIHADMDTAWDIFTDMTCWNTWNRVARNVSSEPEAITEGKWFRFCISPFSIPVHIEPVVDEVIPQKRVVWSGARFGIRARHEFLFSETQQGTALTSRESFSAGFLNRLWFHIPKKKLHALTIAMLEQLKAAAEQSNAKGQPPEMRI